MSKNAKMIFAVIGIATLAFILSGYFGGQPLGMPLSDWTYIGAGYLDGRLVDGTAKSFNVFKLTCDASAARMGYPVRPEFSPDTDFCNVAICRRRSEPGEMPPSEKPEECEFAVVDVGEAFYKDVEIAPYGYVPEYHMWFRYYKSLW